VLIYDTHKKVAAIITLIITTTVMAHATQKSPTNFVERFITHPPVYAIIKTVIYWKYPNTLHNNLKKSRKKSRGQSP